MSDRADLPPDAKDIVDDEVGMAARVARRIAQSLAKQAEEARPQKRVEHDRELTLLRDQIGEARNEDVPALLAAMMHTAGVARIDTPKATGMVDPQTPYFGHLRLEESGRQRDVLIGKRGMIDREAGVVIVDWRDAPVSRLYYRYDEGDEYEEELGDKVREGRVVARRTVSFVAGDLVRVRCASGTFVKRGHNGEAQWTALAAREAPELKGGVGKAERAPAPSSTGRLGLGDAHLRADKHLPEIAALIDPKQFGAMTSPQSGLIVLQGGAGSGKTTVALHRVAYLAFEAPKMFRPQHMIVVVAQPQLAKYVERLLPALDCEGVRVFAYRDWARMAVEKLLGRGRPKKGLILGRRLLDEPPPDVSRVKKHPAMIDAVRAQWTTKLDALGAAIARAVDGKSGADVVTDAWSKLRTASTPTIVRVRAFVDDVEAVPDRDTVERVRRLVEPFLEASEDVVADWEDLVTDRARLAAALTNVDAATLDAAMRYTKRQIEDIPDLSDIDDEHKTPVDDAGPDPDDPIQAFDDHDLALLLLMHVERHGALLAHDGIELAYDHIVVDEAQDLSATELAPLVVASGERRSITLAGDVVQKVVFDNGYDDWPELEAQLAPFMLGRRSVNVEPFRLSYRSTAEVVAFARDVLGPLAPKEAPRAVRTGAPVEVFSFTDPGEEIAFLAENLRSLMAREPQASVALLCRYPERARFYAQMLSKAEVPRLRLVLGARDADADTHDDFTFAPGIDVTHTSRVKGLEYDYVILAEVTEAMYPEQVSARHLLHIGATRAAHQLWITTTAQSPSPLLPRDLLDNAL